MKKRELKLQEADCRGQSTANTMTHVFSNLATYPAGHLPVPFVGAVGVTVTGVEGQRIT